MKHGVVIAHANLGEALIKAAKSIMGTDEGLFPLSVTDMSAQEIESRLSAILHEPREDIDGTIVMACLRGGSSWNVSAALCQDRKRVRLMSGANLPMLLTFLIHRDSMSLDELVETMNKQAKEGVTVL